MPFEMTRNVQMRRDRDGRVRQLSHVQQPYRPARVELEAAGMTGGALTPRALAEQYLRDVADIYGLAPAAMANFAATPTPGPSGAPTELRFKEEKAAGGVAAVSYDQTHLGLPIWEAGMTVRIDTAPMQVTGSQNAMHYEIQVTRPDPNAPYLPHRLDPQRLEQVFGLASAPRVNATRMLIYRYEPAERFDPQIAAHRDRGDATGLAGKDAGEFPALPLPPVAALLQAGRHYVVSEVLFTLAYPGWGTLNWRAFVEPETGSVLYLRALVSCVSGTVFLTDPVTASGVLHSAGDPAGSLDPLRSTVSLLGLTTAAGAQQELTGEYVRLVEVDPPGTPMPREGAPFDFSYSCKTDNFAACNAYHHCDAVFRLIQGMGIDVATYFNNTDFPVPVDPHALRGQVNAQARGNFTGTGMEAFVFGVARAGELLGIAADVRVVLHEFGHALLWDHVSSPNFGFAHSAGDSLAAILHDPGSRAPDRFETFPFMKASAGLSRRHDRKVADGWAWGGPPSKDDTQYGSEQILSTTLFRVYQAAGGDAASLDEQRFAARYLAYLIIKACGLLTFRTRDPDVYVAALTDADAGTVSFEGHPGGSLGKVLRWSFEKQGLYDGAPPEVDVYIDDGRSGEYMPYLADFQGSAAVWNRQAADGGPDHQAPRVGLLNHAYVAVQNRGTTPAAGIEVRGFQSRLPGARTWPTDWKPMATARIVVPGSLAPGARMVVGPLDWTPQFEGESLLASVSAEGDRSNLESVTTGPILSSRLVPLDNNIAQRTM